MNWLSGGRNGYLRCKKALLRHDDEIGVFFEVSRCHGLNDYDFVIGPHRQRAQPWHSPSRRAGARDVALTRLV